MGKKEKKKKKKNPNARKARIIFQKKECQISVAEESKPIKTLYNRLLTAGPTRDSLRVPSLFADFYKRILEKGHQKKKKKKKCNAIILCLPLHFPMPQVHELALS